MAGRDSIGGLVWPVSQFRTVHGLTPTRSAALTARANAGDGQGRPPGTTADVRGVATRARERQSARQGKPNARLSPREIDTHCAPDVPGAALLAQAMARLSLSARAYHRILKVARTIADLADHPTIGAAHVAEAVGYRRFDRM